MNTVPRYPSNERQAHMIQEEGGRCVDSGRIESLMFPSTSERAEARHRRYDRAIFLLAVVGALVIVLWGQR